MNLELDAIINSEMFTNSYPEKRKESNRYATVLIASCKHPDFWYRNLIGIEIFCKLHFSNYGYGEFLREAQAVRLTNTTILKGRTFDPSDIIII